jgi:hypothetical protein
MPPVIGRRHIADKRMPRVSQRGAARRQAGITALSESLNEEDFLPLLIADPPGHQQVPWRTDAEH